MPPVESPRYSLHFCRPWPAARWDEKDGTKERDTEIHGQSTNRAGGKAARPSTCAPQLSLAAPFTTRPVYLTSRWHALRADSRSRKAVPSYMLMLVVARVDWGSRGSRVELVAVIWSWQRTWTCPKELDCLHLVQPEAARAGLTGRQRRIREGPEAMPRAARPWDGTSDVLVLRR